MTTHVRQQIRDRIASNVTGLTTTGDRVYKSRVWPLNADTMPALLVHSTSEDSATDIMGPSLVTNRELSVVVEGYVRNITVYDDKVDTIAKEVEIAMAADQTLNDLAKFSYLSGTEISYSGEGDQPIAVVSMTYLVQYRTAVDSPDVPL